MPGISPAAVADRARDAVEHVAMAARLARDLPAFLRRPLSVEQARRHVLAGLARREARFLELVDRTVVRNPRSPYRRLLTHVGCEPGDLRALVADEGLEGALRRLADLGVYVTFDEFKGRRVAVRGSARFTFTDRDFDSPLCRAHHYVDLTGGSTGRPLPVKRTPAFIEDAAAIIALVYEAHGIRQPRHIVWRGGSPTVPLIHLKLGHPIPRWFYPVDPLPLASQIGLPYISALARLAGVRLPVPEHCGLNEPERIVQAVLEAARPGGPVVVDAMISSAVRVANAAAVLGHALSGVTFHGTGEPLTAHRRRLLEAVGARVVVDYSSNEIPMIASGCPHGTTTDDVHLMTNVYAVIERARALFEGGPAVDALLFTTLTPSASKIGINVELGDAARVDERDCGCLLGSLGLRTHLSEIRSFEKLSSEGTTFFRSNVVQILEEALPARFGGQPMAYQLVEEEAADGATRLILRVDPGVGPLDEAAVRAALLDGLRQGGLVNEYQTRLLEQVGAVSVQRLAPIATPAGKVLPYQLQKRTTRSPS